MTVIQELESIRKRHDGFLRPADVVAFARNPKTSLHERFEWDDGKAAEKYRLEQARHLIRFTVRVISDDAPPIPFYVSLKDDRDNGDSYRALADVMDDPSLRTKLLGQALREAEAWRVRYERLAELRPIAQAIKRVKKSQRVAVG